VLNNNFMEGQPSMYLWLLGQRHSCLSFWFYWGYACFC